MNRSTLFTSVATAAFALRRALREGNTRQGRRLCPDGPGLPGRGQSTGSDCSHPHNLARFDHKRAMSDRVQVRSVSGLDACCEGICAERWGATETGTQESTQSRRMHSRLNSCRKLTYAHAQSLSESGVTCGEELWRWATTGLAFRLMGRSQEHS